MTLRAVIFDLGGVVLGSPFEAISAYEKAHGIPKGFIARLIASGGEQSAWHGLERGELTVAEFAPRFEAEAQTHAITLDGKALIAAIFSGTKPRPSYLRAIDAIRRHGLLACALTNNWKGDSTSALHAHFDVFLESSQLGLRKPDPRIYELACAKLNALPSEVVYLDDIGTNLKPARQLGFVTIKVDEPEAALTELEGVLGFSLR